MFTGGIERGDSTATWRGASWWFFPALTTAAFAFAVSWTASFPGVPLAGVGLVGLLGFAAVVLWLVCVWRMTRLSRLAVGIVSIALMVSSIAVTVNGTPLRVRFAASAAAFEAVVAEADNQLANGDANRDPDVFPTHCPTTIGRFSISECTSARTKAAPADLVAHHGYLFLQSWDAVTDDSGIAYLPDGVNPWSGWDKPRHLTGPWYSVTCGC